jgi:hypothetical protein
MMFMKLFKSRAEQLFNLIQLPRHPHQSADLSCLHKFLPWELSSLTFLIQVHICFSFAAICLYRLDFQPGSLHRKKTIVILFSARDLFLGGVLPALKSPPPPPPLPPFLSVVV